MLLPHHCVALPACCPLLQYCFLYSEYREVYCFWEFVIMARKLFFLAATILLPMALTASEQVVAQLQLQVRRRRPAVEGGKQC